MYLIFLLYLWNQAKMHLSYELRLANVLVNNYRIPFLIYYKLGKIVQDHYCLVYKSLVLNINDFKNICCSMYNIKHCIFENLIYPRFKLSKLNGNSIGSLSKLNGNSKWSFNFVPNSRQWNLITNMYIHILCGFSRNFCFYRFSILKFL